MFYLKYSFIPIVFKSIFFLICIRNLQFVLRTRTIRKCVQCNLLHVIIFREEATH